MKDDAPAPDRVPTKRAALHSAPPLWLRQWLERNDLHPNERRRVLKEIQRRKDDRPQVKLAMVGPEQGMTPAQIRKARELLERIEPTHIYLRGPMRKVFPLIKKDTEVDYDGRFHMHRIRDGIREATVVVAFTKETAHPGKDVEGVWDAIRFAKHRNLPVRIVLPNGDEPPQEGS